jgi:putative FmdB family regulatory protein
MPLYEYTCSDCGRKFEFLTREGQSPSCPGCGGVRLEKLFSTYAVSVGGGGSHAHAAPSPCGTCSHPGGPGSCQWANN